MNDAPVNCTIGERSRHFTPSYLLRIRFTICSVVYFTISFPVTGEYAFAARAYRSLKKSYISVIVPTVERGFLPVVFCSMAIMGLNPVIECGL